jgi:hypothetical protein
MEQQQQVVVGVAGAGVVVGGQTAEVAAAVAEAVQLPRVAMQEANSTLLMTVQQLLQRLQQRQLHPSLLRLLQQLQLRRRRQLKCATEQQLRRLLQLQQQRQQLGLVTWVKLLRRC